MNTALAAVRTTPARTDSATALLGAAIVLEGAAELIRYDGWAQGGYWPCRVTARAWRDWYTQGQPCDVLGALAVMDGVTEYAQVRTALTERDVLLLAVAALETWINRTNASIADAHTTLERWNDDPDRTATEVITTMRSAAGQLRAEHRRRTA